MSSEASTVPRQGRDSIGLCANSEYSEISISSQVGVRWQVFGSYRALIVDLLRASGGLFEFLDEPFPGLHLSLPRRLRYSFPLHHLGLQKLHSSRAFVDLGRSTQYTPRGAPPKHVTHMRLEKTVVGRGGECPLCDRRSESPKEWNWRRRANVIDGT